MIEQINGMWRTLRRRYYLFRLRELADAEHSIAVALEQVMGDADKMRKKLDEKRIRFALKLADFK